MAPGMRQEHRQEHAGDEEKPALMNVQFRPPSTGTAKPYGNPTVASTRPGMRHKPEELADGEVKAEVVELDGDDAPQLPDREAKELGKDRKTRLRGRRHVPPAPRNSLSLGFRE
jgi:hypothetical protein